MPPGYFFQFQLRGLRRFLFVAVVVLGEVRDGSLETRRVGDFVKIRVLAAGMPCRTVEPLERSFLAFLAMRLQLFVLY